MKEMFEEYGGVIAIAVLGLTVIGGLIKVLLYMKSHGLF